MIYYLTYDEHSYMVREPWSAQADEAFPDRGSSGLDVYPRSLHRSDPRVPHDLIDTERAVYGGDDVSAGSMAYVVVVTYEDGDTFGSSGYWCVAAVCSTPEAAKAIAERCHDGNDCPEGGSAYRPWDGYFAHIRAAEVVPMTVLA